MNKEYLPSKQFITRVIIIIILTVGIFGVYKLIKNKSNTSDVPLIFSIIQSTQKDSNDNGIPDWEEKLWGLNPNKKGVENKEFILEKRKALNPNADFSKEENLTESDNLSHELFAIVMALQQTGELDENAIEVISKTFSQKIEAEIIPDKYTIEMIKSIDDTSENVVQYHDSFKNLILKYENRNIGDELTFLIQGIAYNDQQVIDLMGTVGTAYEEFGKELMEIPTPLMLSYISLNIANIYEKNAQSIEGLTMVFSDPVVATRSIVNYKKYNDDLAILLNSLSYIFETE